MQLVVALGVGLAAGLLSSILGVGGGIVLIPGLVLLLGASQHTAQGVSLVVIAATALAGTLAHQRRGNVEVRVALWIIPSAVVFALSGAFLAGRLEPHWLQRVFAGIMFFLGGWLVLRR